MSDDVVVQQRDFPWLQCGTKVDGLMSTAEAIKAAELDWTVSKRKLFFEGVGGKKPLPKRYAIARDTDDLVLGTVGSHYVPFQNIEAFTFADALLANETASIEAAGSMRGGRVVFIVMKLNGDEIMVAGEDAHNLYLLLRTSHDASKAIGAYITIMRMKCTNQEQLVVAGARQKWAVPHVSTVNGRLEEAREALELTSKYADAFKQTADKLAAIDIEVDEFRKMLRHVVPERPKTPDVIDKIVGLYESSPTSEDFRGTAWGALNAITEYFDWGRDTKSVEARWLSSVDGQGSVIRNRAAGLLLRRGNK